jgi:hypothetical protein
MQSLFYHKWARAIQLVISHMLPEKVIGGLGPARPRSFRVDSWTKVIY